MIGSAASWHAREYVASPVTASPPQAQGFDHVLEKPEWRRALYERQPFEDNYVDPVQFMQEMRKNDNLSSYHMVDIVKDTFVVIQQISIVVIFANMFVSIVRHEVAIWSIVVVDMFVVLVAVAIYRSKEQRSKKGPRGSSALWNGLRQITVLVSALMILSPIFQTLTQSYTDDTIWALTITLLTVHVLGTDYTYLNGYTEIHSHTISTNSALFATILLASRIPSPAFACALIGFGALCFILSPMLRHNIKKSSFMLHVGITFLLCGVAFGFLADVPLLAGSFVALILVIAGAVPWFFVSLQHRFKFQINGPWDEARPQNSAAAAEWATAGLLS